MRRIFSVIMAFVLAVSIAVSAVGYGENDTKAVAASTWRSSLYPENWEPGYTTNGMFLHDYSYAGYKLGETAVPDTMGGMFIDVTQAPYNADNTGANDATMAIQSAIDAVQAAGGGTVYLPAGTFKIKPQGSNTYALRISSSNVLLKGAGEGKTFIRGFKESMRNSSLILVQPTSYTSWDNDSGTVWKLTKDVPDQDTSELQLANVNGLNVGDWVIVRTDRTQSWIDEMQMSGYWSPNYNYAVTFYRQITAIDASKNTITIDIPTKFAMKVRDNARVYKCNPNLQNVGLSDFSIGNKQYPQAPNSTGFGEEDYTTSGTAAYNVHNSFLISFNYCVNSWAKNISTYKAGNSYEVHMQSNGLNLNRCRSLTIDNCDFSHPQYEGGGGNGYGMNICAEDCLIKDCSSTSARHSFSFKYGFSNGNVIYHYTSTDPKYGSDFHMYLSFSNLIDNEELNGDFVESVVRPYGATAGNRHGYTSSQTVFWNTKGNYYKSGNNYIIDSRQYGYGYIIGTQGAATAVKTTPTTMALSYGTANTAPEDFKEGIGQGADLYPQSLYYDQLERRLARGNKVTEIPGNIAIGDYSLKTSGITMQTSPEGVAYAGDFHDGYALNYNISVPAAGTYTISLGLAGGDAQYNAQSITVGINENSTAVIPVTGSNSWTNFINHQADLTFNAAGTYKLSITVNGGACNIANINISKKVIEQTTQAPETTQTPTKEPESSKPSSDVKPEVTGGYNLVVADISWEGGQDIVAGAPVVWKVTIKNNGDRDIPAGNSAAEVIGYQVQVDGQTVAWCDSYNEGLKAGQSVTLSCNGGPGGINYWNAVTGTHTITAWVDDVDRWKEEVIESNPGSLGDNQYSINITVSNTVQTTEAHSIGDNFINFGEEEMETEAPTEAPTQPAIELPVLKFNTASLVLESSLTVNFGVKKVNVDGYYTDLYAVFELNGKKTVVEDYTDNGTTYVFGFANVASNNMNDTIKATICAKGVDGKDYVGNTTEYSVAKYCYTQLGKSTLDAASRTLFVDLLNYGAEAQKFTNYKTNDLVNVKLTPEQASWGTSTYPEFQNITDSKYAVVSDPYATMKAVALELESTITVRIKFVAESTEGLTAKVVAGSKTWELSESDFEKITDGYYIHFAGLNATQMRLPMYVTFYKDGKAVSNTLRYSIESFAKAKESDAKHHDLLIAMMKYGDSADRFANR